MKIEDISPGRYWMYDLGDTAGVVVGEVLDISNEKVICRLKSEYLSKIQTVARNPP